MRIALGLEYCGTPFRGWQSQADGRGAQDALERALAAIAAMPVRTVAAGRTDRGVHAALQVVHFDAPVTRPQMAWVRGVNTHLPQAMAVLWAHPVSDAFHARFAASARHYTYLLSNRAVRSALFADRIGWYHRPLDVDAMRAGTRALVGTHDFSVFRAAECQARTPIKTLAQIDIAREGELLRFDFSADAFLHHMIRNIIGSLLHVGSGKAPPAWIAELLASRDRTRAAATFAPEGLYLTGVDYPADYGLPFTRRTLGLPLAVAP